MAQFVCEFFRAGHPCQKICPGAVCVCEAEMEDMRDEPGYHVARKEDWEVA